MSLQSWWSTAWPRVMLGITPVCVGRSSPQLPWQYMVMTNSFWVPSLLTLWFELFLSPWSLLSVHGSSESGLERHNCKDEFCDLGVKPFPSSVHKVLLEPNTWHRCEAKPEDTSPPILPHPCPHLQAVSAADFNPAPIASSVLPAGIQESLKDEEVTEGQAATLRCELTKAAPVEWRKGSTLLQASDKYKMRQEGTVRKLLIQDVELKDAGEYTCVCGEQETTAALIVHGKNNTQISVLLWISVPAHWFHSCVHLWLNYFFKSVNSLWDLVVPRLLFSFCLLVCPVSQNYDENALFPP